jgi:hypothetical protein
MVVVGSCEAQKRYGIDVLDVFGRLMFLTCVAGVEFLVPYRGIYMRSRLNF